MSIFGHPGLSSVASASIIDEIKEVQTKEKTLKKITKELSNLSHETAKLNETIKEFDTSKEIIFASDFDKLNIV